MAWPSLLFFFHIALERIREGEAREAGGRIERQEHSLAMQVSDYGSRARTGQDREEKTVRPEPPPPKESNSGHILK